MNWLIERTDSAEPTFYSHIVGRDFGSPLGGWTTEPEKAATFTDEGEAQAFLDGTLAMDAPYCKLTNRIFG